MDRPEVDGQCSLKTLLPRRKRGFPEFRLKYFANIGVIELSEQRVRQDKPGVSCRVRVPAG